jgi:hypothetical protein
MSLALGLLATASSEIPVLELPVAPHSIAQHVAAQLSAFPMHSPHSLIVLFTHILGLVVHLSDSLSEDMRLTYYAEGVTLEGKLRETQVWVERHKIFMDDLAAKQTRKRRRRRKRVVEQVDLP